MRGIIDCPNCQTTDITFRYNKISHVAAGFLIANLLAKNVGATAGGRFSIHDVVIDDMNSARYNGGGGLATIGNGWPSHVLNSISITHVTAFTDPAHTLLVMGNSQNNPQMWGFTFDNNVLINPRYPVWSVGNYVNDCSAHDIPVETINLCFKDNQFINNVLIGPTTNFPPSKWPTGNFFATDIPSVRFVAYGNGNGGDYTLSKASPYRGKATDGTDPGANISLLEQEISGVE